MSNITYVWRAARLLFASAALFVAVVWAVPAFGQETQPSPPPAQPQQQTPSQPATQPTPPQQQPAPAQPDAPPQEPAPATPAAQGEPVAAPAAEPLFREYKGVTLNMSADEARGKLGRPAEQDKTQDVFLFSESQRARLYYDDKGRVSAVIVTYIGKGAGAPEAKAVLGEEVEARPDGSAYKLVTYPRAGYWVAYSRTAGDEPLTIITMQRTQVPNN
jgi:hypothetical protein